MPRKPRFFLPKVPAYVVQRGHNRDPVFFEIDDYNKAYLGCLQEASERYGCFIHAYALMDNRKAIRASTPLIIKISMNRIEKRVNEHYQAEFSHDDETLTHIVARSQEVDTGARNIENSLTRTLLPEMAPECLSRMAANEAINRIHVGVDEAGKFACQID